MPDVIPTPAAPPPPTWLQRVCTALLPQFIAYSRKGLIWFSGLSGVMIAEYCKVSGEHLGWTADHITQWNGRMMLLQAFAIAISKMWTQQIADEDKALKTGLPPPTAAQVPQNVAGGNITVLEQRAPAPAPTIDPAAAGKGA